MSNLFQCVACQHEITLRIMPLFCNKCGRSETYALLEDEEENQGAVSACSVDSEEPERFASGDPTLDSALLGGFVRPGTLTAFGKAGSGKSRSCLRWATHIGKTLLISLEMPTKLSVLSAKNARANLKNLYITESEHGFASEAEKIDADILIFDSYNYSRRKPKILLEDLKDWANAVNGIVLLICHQNKKGVVKGTTDAEHWPDYLMKFTKSGNSEAKILIEKARYAPTGSCIITI